jgi:sugar phosphate permease
MIGVRQLRFAGDVISGRSHVYYGWWVLATATIAMAIGSGVSMSAFGLYVGPLEDEFGWTRAEVSLGFSASVLMGGLSGPLVGYWIDAKGARSAIIVGGALCALSYILLASTQTLWQFYVFYAVHAFCRQLMFFIPFQSLVGQWFRRRRGVALSILGSGFSIGGFAILPLMAVMIDTLGWRGAYLFSGALVAAFFLPAGLLIIRNRPSDVGEYVDGDAEADAVPAAAAALAEDDRSVTLKQAMRMPLFWVLAFGFMFLFFGMMGWMVHQVPFYESQGMSRGTAALIVSLSAGASVIARLSMGLVADRFQRFEVAVIGLLGLMFLAMGTLLISTSPPAIALFLLFWVTGASAGPMVESLVLIKAFGMRFFGSILGACLVVETLGQIISPSLAGKIYDDTGSYDGALILFMSTFAAGMVLFAIAARMRTSGASPAPVEDRVAVTV